jgi:hypothetical protein
LITSFTSDEARREAVISRMCERLGFDREKVENFYPCCARCSKMTCSMTGGESPPIRGEWLACGGWLRDGG